MKYKIRVRSIYEFGKRKDALGNAHQEDSIFPTESALNDSDRVFILCDGMGGHDKGEVASATVCSTMGETVLREVADSEGAFSDCVLQDALAASFKALDEKDSGAVKKMGTTMTFLKLHNGGYTAAHIGDSRIYHFRPGASPSTTKILFKSEDHSLVNDLIKIGELTEEEARNYPQRNVITRAMQPHDERLPKADVHHSSDIKKGDYFYMCSDGMLEQATDDNLKFFFSKESAVDTIDKKVEALTLATMENSDNHTAFLIEIIDVEGKAMPIEECTTQQCPLLIFKDREASPVRKLEPIINPTQAAVESTAISDISSKRVRKSSTRGASTQKADDKKNKNSILIYILSALLVVLVILVIYFFLIKGKQEMPENDIPDEDDARIENIKTNVHSTRSEEPSNYEAVPTGVKNCETRTKVVIKNKVQTNKPVINNPTNENIVDHTNTVTSQELIKKPEKPVEDKTKKEVKRNSLKDNNDKRTDRE
ncbi:MAG: protein phosphatase 2C domain-containing protein [Prevotella sp.]|nr:protein phosphatase 2C domain-containing protein [Bacteroides sp.]MCM1366428.1 protein phosphatase 2C domain-containing protein [Prevotella sp.]